MARKPPTKTRETTTKQQRVYGVLRERIRTGVYEPGHRIVIDQLAAEFGVSPLPVREAVRRMQAEGLVVSRPNSSACVAPADPELVEPIIELLAVVEGYVTALAAPHLARRRGRTACGLSRTRWRRRSVAATAVISRGSTASSTRCSKTIARTPRS